MAYNYVVTAQKATAVTASATGYLLMPGRMNVVIARNNHLEIYVVDDIGFHSLKTFTILGEIAVMKVFRHMTDKTDKIFLLTSSFQAIIIETEFVDEKNTDTLSPIRIDRIGRPSETGIIGIIDPQARMIGLRLYDAMFKVIPLSKDMTEIECFNIRLDELNIVDMAFLSGFNYPTVMLIHQDAIGRHAKVYDISIPNKEFVTRDWNQENVENESTMIIPVFEPLCGALIIGQETISYLCGDEHYLTIGPPAIQQSSLCCYTPVDKDGCRYLLGDMSGRIFMLILETERQNTGCSTSASHASSAGPAPATTTTGTTGATVAAGSGDSRGRSVHDTTKNVPRVSKAGMQVTDLRLEYLGEVSIPDSVTYLDNGVAFIGSRLGDSQLVKLHTDEHPQTGTFVEVLYTFANLGPIVDMCVVDLEKQGQGQLITCSGGFKDGSLRIIRNGIGINESITIDLPLIKGIWALRINSEIDNYLILTFINETRVLKLGGPDEVEEIELEGFDYDQDTCYSGNVAFDQIVQVTTTSMHLIKESSRKRVATWTAPNEIKLFVVSCNHSHLMIGSGHELFYFEFKDECIALVTHRKMEYEIACIDISPLGEQTYCCAIGMWSSESIHLVSLPDLNTLLTESIEVELLPRAILQMKFDDTNYLLITIGDGTLYYYVMNDDCTRLYNRKRVVLGTQPISLRCLTVAGKPSSVFACSDRPTVIYSSNNKIVFSNVNLKSVNLMCPLNAQNYKNSLVMVSEKGLTIGQIDEMQKLHIRTIPMGETVRRIHYQESTETFGVLTLRQEFKDASRNKGKPVSKSTHNITIANNTKTNQIHNSTATHDMDEIETHSLVVMDQNTFEVKAVFQFLPFEFANSLSILKVDDSSEYFVVGTAYMNDEDAEPQRGRVILLSYDRETDKIIQECYIEVSGAVYSINCFRGMILTTVNSTIQVYELVMSREKEIRRVCSAFNNIITLLSKVQGDFVLVGDLMRSITLLHYKEMDHLIEEVARDFNSNWMTALEILDEDTFLGAENSSNIFCCTRKHVGSDKNILVESGHFHLGEFVNVFLQGSLVMQNQIDRSYPTDGSTLFGAISGYIGFSTRLNEEMFCLLSELQLSIEKNIKQFGNIRVTDYRMFSNEHRKVEMNGFIDGDFVEMFIDMTVEEQKSIVKDIDLENLVSEKVPTVDEIVKIMEELSRIH